MSGWNDEAITLLKGWMAEGLSFGTLERLFAERGFAFSRNAVIGKAHRLRISPDAQKARMASLPKAEASRKPGRPRKARVAAVPAPPPAVARSAPTMRAAAPRPVMVPPAGPSVIAAHPAHLWLIPAGGCHFPVSGEGAQTLFCADPAADGKRYCPHHHRLAHVPPEGRAASRRAA